jgi:hypothetical protein
MANTRTGSVADARLILLARLPPLIIFNGFGQLSFKAFLRSDLTAVL